MKTQNKSRRKTFRATIITLFVLVAPAIVYASENERVYGMTPERLRSVVGGVIGLTSIIVGIRARRSAVHMGTRRSEAIIALCLGLLSVTLSVLHLASTTGGFGTGKGRAGAIISCILGLIGILINWQALTRFRQATKDRNKTGQ